MVLKQRHSLSRLAQMRFQVFDLIAYQALFPVQALKQIPDSFPVQILCLLPVQVPVLLPERLPLQVPEQAAL